MLFPSIAKQARALVSTSGQISLISYSVLPSNFEIGLLSIVASTYLPVQQKLPVPLQGWLCRGGASGDPHPWQRGAEGPGLQDI